MIFDFLEKKNSKSNTKLIDYLIRSQVMETLLSGYLITLILFVYLRKQVWEGSKSCLTTLG